MKIDDAIKLPGTNTPSPVASKAAKATEKSLGPESSSVRLTTPGQVTSAVASSMAVFDGHKVAKIKEAIADGTFKVDVDKVADGLIQSVHDALKARKDK